MSERGSQKGRPVNVDVALRQWPSSDPDGAAWEDRAQSVMNRLERGERGATSAYIDDAELLVAPLGRSAEDASDAGAAMTASAPIVLAADRDRDRQNLRDLAKMAPGLTPSVSMPSGVQRASEASKDDSGIVDLAAASRVDPGAVARAQSTPLASDDLFDDPPPSLPLLAKSAGPAVAPVRRSQTPASVQPIAQASKKQGGATVAIVIGGLIAFSAAAAGSFMYLRPRSTAPNAVATVALPTPDPMTPAPSTIAPPVPSPIAPTEPPSDSNAIAHVAPPTKASAGRIASAKSGVRLSARSAKPDPASAAEPATTSATPDLGAALKKEVGDEPAKIPAAGPTGGNATGNVPQKPSQGAVTGALGGVLSQARACLGPDDPISRAAIVFTSRGTVDKVTVTGGAVGKPAESCIKDALGKAKLQPFAEPTYTANITIRHN